MGECKTSHKQVSSAVSIFQKSTILIYFKDEHKMYVLLTIYLIKLFSKKLSN